MAEQRPPRAKGRGAQINPANRYAQWQGEADLEYLEHDPEAVAELASLKTEYLTDNSRSIVSENDSPDIPFRFSLNPYRGCLHGCSYCLSGDTLILMADGTTRALRDVRVGDAIYGTERRGVYRRYVETRVLDHWGTVKPAHRVTLQDGTTLIASGDHRFLTNRGWKHVAGTGSGTGQRPFLTTNNKLMGMGRFAGSVVTSGRVVESAGRLGVIAVEPLGVELPLFDITTGTGDFIANGVISHNCYARPTHEYLGLSAGLDFETKIFVKEEAPALFREWLSRRNYVPEPVMFSGITDCYQPAERNYKLTRGCLEVALDARQPVGIITKNALVARDMDLLREMAAYNVVRVALSVTSLDQELARVLEPRTSAPAARLRAVRAFADAGVPVHVMIGPVIPGLNDSEIPAILEAAAAAGAQGAGYNLLRLPLTVKPVFLDWLERERPLAKERVEGLIRSTRGGGLNDTNFGSRMRGTGPIADQIKQAFRVFARKHKLDGPWSPLETSHFRPPVPRSGQLRLF